MPQHVEQHVPEAELVGAGKFTYLFWDVYDAQLFAPSGEWQNAPPYALTLTYLRNFAGEDIAKRSIKEMRKQGFNDDDVLASWQQLMADTFPDVIEGESLTGVLKSDMTTVFYKDDDVIGIVEDTAFGQQFFAIWLNEKTSEPALRKKLIGGK